MFRPSLRVIPKLICRLLTSVYTSHHLTTMVALSACKQTSPGNAHSPSRLCLPHIRPCFPYRYWTLKIIDFSSSMAASYAIPVRRASVLPAASFRFNLTIDTLAVRLTVPSVGPVRDLHPQVSAPCRAHHKKGQPKLMSCF